MHVNLYGDTCAIDTILVNPGKPLNKKEKPAPLQHLTCHCQQVSHSYEKLFSHLGMLP